MLVTVMEERQAGKRTPTNNEPSRVMGSNEKRNGVATRATAPPSKILLIVTLVCSLIKRKVTKMVSAVPGMPSLKFLGIKRAQGLSVADKIEKRVGTPPTNGQTVHQKRAACTVVNPGIIEKKNPRNGKLKITKKTATMVKCWFQ